jgi:hypothetical protein
MTSTRSVTFLREATREWGKVVDAGQFPLRRGESTLFPAFVVLIS